MLFDSLENQIDISISVEVTCFGIYQSNNIFNRYFIFFQQSARQILVAQHFLEIPLFE